MIVAGINEPIQVNPNQLMVARQSIQGWVAADPNARKNTIDFSILTDVHPMIETFKLEEIDLAYEKMMTAKVRFRAVITMD